jgi:hypothetical protein
MVDHLPGMHKALDPILSIEKKLIIMKIIYIFIYFTLQN